MQKTIIILSGAKRSGKDTVAGMIKCHIPSATTVAFADKLKKASAVLLNEIYGTNTFTQDMFSNEEFRQGPFPGDKQFIWGGEQVCLRTVLQRFGTEICRNCIDPDIWTKSLANTITQIDSGCIIITDARFPNEIEYITNKFKSTHRVLTVLIKRPGLVSNDTHASESNFGVMEEKGLFMHVVENDADLVDLEGKVKMFLSDSNVTN